MESRSRRNPGRQPYPRLPQHTYWSGWRVPSSLSCVHPSPPPILFISGSIHQEMQTWLTYITPPISSTWKSTLIQPLSKNDPRDQHQVMLPAAYLDDNLAQKRGSFLLLFTDTYVLVWMGSVPPRSTSTIPYLPRDSSVPYNRITVHWFDRVRYYSRQPFRYNDTDSFHNAFSLVSSSGNPQDGGWFGGCHNGNVRMITETSACDPGAGTGQTNTVEAARWRHGRAPGRPVAAAFRRRGRRRHRDACNINPFRMGTFTLQKILTKKTF